MPFTNKLVLITGGSSGIGLALAKKLAAQGAHVWILARNPEKLDSACKEISAARASNTQKVGTLSVDVSDYARVCQVLEDFTRVNGTPDLLINSAGITHPGLFENLDIEVFHEMIQVNYLGLVHVTKALIPFMIQRRSGHIVNISSMVGFLGLYGYSAYGPSKFAVRGLSDVLRSELAEYGIRVSIVFPPDTDTPQLEYENQFKPPLLKKLVEINEVRSPEYVADWILKRISRRRYIITPGYDSTFLYYLSNLLGNLTYRVIDFLVDRARRSLR